MKLTFLLQIFILGFFSEVVLTSPLIARQIDPNQCPTGVGSTCSLSIQLNPASYTCATIPNVTCTPNPLTYNVTCSVGTNIDIKCFGNVEKYIFSCPVPSQNECGFTCTTCIYDQKIIDCGGCNTT
ncbi:452_t:CDS:1 [Cetraspora pellucida]|uniref:452_t:CDS:1 n=1 Tax=Cetraspora pellucida TaxID=1433469 RepID=A0A9N9EAM4_9GLOM|nr:452_t:CDS:1 [Cetraspora pellucida]